MTNANTRPHFSHGGAGQRNPLITISPIKLPEIRYNAKLWGWISAWPDF